MIPRKIGFKLSARRRLPVLLAFDREFWPHDFVRFLWRTRSWKVLEENPVYGIYKIGGIRLKLLRVRNPAYASPSYTRSFFTHYFDWMSEYRPPFPLKGKTVLEGGSGVGETATLFFALGAKKLICVDINPQACGVLRENADANGWDIKIINEPFSTRHLLETEWDFCKLDIETGESCLLSLDKLPDKPMVMETHGVQLTKDLIHKFHLDAFKVMHHVDGAFPWCMDQRGEVSHAMLRNYSL